MTKKKIFIKYKKEYKYLANLQWQSVIYSFGSSHRQSVKKIIFIGVLVFSVANSLRNEEY